MTLEQNNGAEHVFHVAEVQKDVEKGGGHGIQQWNWREKSLFLKSQ